MPNNSLSPYPVSYPCIVAFPKPCVSLRLQTSRKEYASHDDRTTLCVGGPHHLSRLCGHSSRDQPLCAALLLSGLCVCLLLVLVVDRLFSQASGDGATASDAYKTQLGGESETTEFRVHEEVPVTQVSSSCIRIPCPNSNSDRQERPKAPTCQGPPRSGPCL